MRARLFHPVEQRAKSARLVSPLPQRRNALSYREFPPSCKHLPHVQRHRAHQCTGRASRPRGPEASIRACMLASAPQQAVGGGDGVPDIGGATSTEGLPYLAWVGWTHAE